MIFASTELAARIETAERELVTACIAAAARRRPELSTLAIPLGSGVAGFAAPGSPFNKVVGLGFGERPTEDELARMEQAFAARGCPVQVELSTLADPAVGELLTRRGYVLQAFENVLAYAPSPTEPAVEIPEVEVSIVDQDSERATWMRTVIEGFATPDEQGIPAHESFADETLERAIEDMAATEGFRPFLARRRGEIAGAGSLRVSQGLAQLSGAATLPEHRRRGVQTALLDARLLHAARSGCQLALVTTMPGSRSQHNAQRRGFELLYARAILVRAPGA